MLVLKDNAYTCRIIAAASDEQDQIASFSNYGSCVDIFAPVRLNYLYIDTYDTVCVCVCVCVCVMMMMMMMMKPGYGVIYEVIMKFRASSDPFCTSEI